MWISNKPPKPPTKLERDLELYKTRCNDLEGRIRKLTTEYEALEKKTKYSAQDLAALVHADVITADDARDMLGL